MEMNRVEGDVEIGSRSRAIRSSMPGASGRRIAATSRSSSGAIPRRAGHHPADLRDLQHLAPLRRHTALEVAYQSPIAPNGTRIRNLCLMAESVMNDARHTFLMFAPDFCNRPIAITISTAGPAGLRAPVQGRDRQADGPSLEADPGDRHHIRGPVAPLDLHDDGGGHMLA